jgi:hypothetical protein
MPSTPSVRTVTLVRLRRQSLGSMGDGGLTDADELMIAAAHT